MSSLKNTPFAQEGSASGGGIPGVNFTSMNHPELDKFVWQQYARDLKDSVPNINYPDINIDATPPDYGGFAPSFSIGGFGGGPDMSPVLLALLAAGGAGFFLGRRRKKKRKYKKKRRA